MKPFILPDLGEGLPDAEIVRWLVKEGELVALDQPMVEMETAKAVVEVPSPMKGVITKLCGKEGDVIDVGAVLVEFDGEVAVAASLGSDTAKPKDAATVVGAVEVGDQIVAESVSAVINALASKLKVNLAQVTGTGPEGKITQADVKIAKGRKSSKPAPSKAENEDSMVFNSARDESDPLRYKASPAVRALARKQGVALSQCEPTGVKNTISRQDVERAKLTANPTTIHTQSSAGLSAVAINVEPQKIRGVRRAMAMGMAKSHASVVPTTLMEDADITAWPKQDALARYVRALVFGSKIEPALNAWFDGENFERLLHPQVSVGIAIDSPDGLYVPVVKQAESKTADQIRADVQDLRKKIETKGLKQEDQQGATITLSNFGSIAGRYGSPVVSPPQVAILGTGRYRSELKLTSKGIENRKILPLSLTFDHRACTGGEAARFLAAVIADLEKAN